MHTPHITTTRALERRTFLKGVGVSLALPMLEAMLPSFAWAKDLATPAARHSFVGVMTNMGILPQFFFPEKDGRDYELTPYLELLKDHRADLSIFSGVSLPGVDGGHASEKSFLTGAPGAGTGSFKNTVSLDQVMAEKLGGETRFPALTLSVAGVTSLAYTRSGSMIPSERSPLRLYQQLFIEDTAEDKAASARRLKEDRSVLDLLRDQAKELENSVGAADRERLDQYYTSVRDLERRLAKNQDWLGLPKPKTIAPVPQEMSNVNDLAKNMRVMFDLVRLALESDSTRIVTFALNTGTLQPALPGVHTQCHELTHHGGREEKISELRKIEEAQFTALSAFLTGLRGVQESGASLLDRTSVLFGTNMGSANAHSTDNLPVLLAGGGFKHGRHLAFDKKRNYPLSNLYVSLLQRMGVEAGTFSSGTTTMRGLELA